MIVPTESTCRFDARYAVRSDHASCAVPFVGPRLVDRLQGSGRPGLAFGASTRVSLP